MKIFKGYKLVAIVYLVVTLVNVAWICSYNNDRQVKNTVKSDKQVVVNY